MKTTKKSPAKKASTTKSVKADQTTGPEIVNVTPESHPAFHKMLSEIAAHAKERKEELIAKMEQSKVAEPTEETSQMDDLIAIQTKAFNAYMNAKADVEHYRIFLQSELNKIN